MIGRIVLSEDGDIYTERSRMSRLKKTLREMSEASEPDMEYELEPGITVTFKTSSKEDPINTSNNEDMNNGENIKGCDIK